MEMISMELGEERFKAIIDASKKASQRGDHLQAERLLKSILRQAQRDMASVGYAIDEISESLATVYELQGRNDEAKGLRERSLQINKKDTDNSNSRLGSSNAS